MIGFTKYEPWEQWPDEPNKAYHRFSMYLKIGPERSIRKVAERLQKGSGYEKHLRRWSSKYNWVKRSGEYDRHLIEKTLKHKEEILDRGMARLLNMMDKALDELESVLDASAVMNVGDGQAHILNQKLKAIDSVLNRIGLIEQKEVPDTGGGIVTMNKYVQNIYTKMRRQNHEENKEEAQ